MVKTGLEYGFGLKFLSHAWLLFKSIIVHSWLLWFGLVMIAGCSYFYSWLSDQIGNQIGAFYGVVSTPITSRHDVLIVLGTVGGLYVALAVIFGIQKAVTGAIAIHVRRLMTNEFNQLYFRNNNFYKVSFSSVFMNPDQYLTQDIDRYSTAYANVVSQLVTSPTFIIYFGVQVARSVHWSAPFCVFGYYLITFFIQRLLMSPVAERTARQERLEGSYRFLFQKIATTAESVALYGGANTDQDIAQASFESVIKNSTTILKWDLFIWMLSYCISYLGSVVGYIVVALPLLISDGSKGLSPEYVATSLSNLGMLAWGFTQITILTSQLAEFAGYTNRIGTLYTYLKAVDKQNGQSSTFEASSFSTPQICDPSGTVLIQDVNLQFDQDTLVMGPSGSGKSSLVRILAGLDPQLHYNNAKYIEQLGFDFLDTDLQLPTTYGDSNHLQFPSMTQLQIRDSTFERPEPNSVLFVPQIPYLPVGDIFQQIVYPLNKVDCPDFTTKQMHSILADVGLSSILQRRDLATEKYWRFLSPGQLQKLSMARVLYHKPKFAVLDEVTSHVDIQAEADFYRICKKLNIRILSVGHRPSLTEFHSRILCLENNRLIERDEVSPVYHRKPKSLNAESPSDS